jgi:choline-glycine betaine transporter
LLYLKPEEKVAACARGSADARPVFVLAGVFITEPFGSTLVTVVGWITDYLGWLYMLMTSFLLGFAGWLALSS